MSAASVLVSDSRKARENYCTKLLTHYQNNISSPLEVPGPQLPTPAGGPLKKDVSDTAPINKIAIVGAGVAGLHVATMLGANFNCDVFEASDRIGGRLYTHKFQGGEWDYFDVGAMRFPKTPVMDRTFELFEALNIETIPYYISQDNNLLAYNLERHRKVDLNVKTYADDPFKVGVSNGGTVPDEYACQDPSVLLHNALKPFIDLLVKNYKAGVKELMRFDHHSTRSYLKVAKEYPPSLINYMETMCYGTGWFDRALAETVFEELCFLYNIDPEKPEEKLDWRCVKGGSSEIINKMKERLDNECPNTVNIFTNHRVTAVNYDPSLFGKEDMFTLSGQDLTSGEAKPFSFKYSHVILAVPPPCLRTMDLSSCNLDYEQRNALRQVTVGPSCKIGIKFKTAWWTKLKDSITGGQSQTDRMARTIVYPSHGKGESTVLIASYTWTQDASSLGALMQGKGTPAQNRLKDIMLTDLAYVHNMKVEDLEKEYEDMFPWDWAHHENSMGAFGVFGPSQFEQYFRALTRPAAGGHMHFVGETFSTTHGWVAGALESAERGALQILALNQMAVEANKSRGGEESKGPEVDLLEEFKKLWNPDFGVKEKLMISQLQISKTLQVKEFGSAIEVSA